MSTRRGAQGEVYVLNAATTRARLTLNGVEIGSIDGTSAARQYLPLQKVIGRSNEPEPPALFGARNLFTTLFPDGPPPVEETDFRIDIDLLRFPTDKSLELFLFYKTAVLSSNGQVIWFQTTQ
jgi:hypothetical protein